MRHWPLVAWVGLVALVACTPALSRFDLRPIDSMVAAAWTQAVGSVLAILVSTLIAVYVPILHSKKSLRDRQALTVLSLMASAQEICAYFASANHLAGAGKFNAHTAEHIASGVRATQADLAQIVSLEMPVTFRIHLVNARANADLALVFLRQAEHLFLTTSSLPKTFFAEPLKNAETSYAKLAEAVAAHPIGRNPMDGYH
jgi:hypothetical protein